MPRLLLLRHAKAERARPGAKDFDRVLAPRGEEDTETIGGLLTERGERPDRVLCSPAARTRETWSALAPHLGNGLEPVLLPSLYEGGDYLEILRREGGGAATLLVIGHNPPVHEAAIRLADSLSGSDGAALAKHFPTAALAILDFSSTWDGLTPGEARLVAFLRPQESAGD